MRLLRRLLLSMRMRRMGLLILMMRELLRMWMGLRRMLRVLLIRMLLCRLLRLIRCAMMESTTNPQMRMRTNLIPSSTQPSQWRILPHLWQLLRSHIMLLPRIPNTRDPSNPRDRTTKRRRMRLRYHPMRL